MAREHRTSSRFYFRLKLWKKKLRRWRRPLWSLAGFLLLLIVLSIAVYMSDSVRDLSNVGKNTRAMETFSMLQEDRYPQLDDKARFVVNQLVQHDEVREVVHRKLYICGQSEHILGKLASTEIIRNILEHPNWAASMDATGQVVFEEQVNDLSEKCKQQAYISLDKDGNLTLFEGRPKEKNAIRTFFQLDVNSMESSLPTNVLDQLYKGIRISDMDQYNSVLSTFSDYAIEETKKVMKPTSTY
ncbi:BofC C-terminal domain-containing protein [Paenibacillus sp. 481]|uniref:BofC C-terminal domain-containing protein n=1 Tax=Paenibacillus sp. 481 TaxID=2835869 RepID=UPI001E32FF6E|nr:BofC C-terminal domain-containing protein [Paenibacillus sp. 481]UHA74339.1 BofC C-terminal domain-containing protein [Paenibacillus sp. 481]